VNICVNLPVKIGKNLNSPTLFHSVFHSAYLQPGIYNFFNNNDFVKSQR